MRRIILPLLLLAVFQLQAQKKKNVTDDAFKGKVTYNDLNFRSVGPSLVSGRIADLAVNPDNSSEYYIAVASGGVWKTTNSGITFTPVFDGEGSYSIGCIAIDPNNSNVVWVGSGENNNQRSVAYGDGIYKSPDGGKTWANMGLKNSEHIGMIAIDPRNSNSIFVACYGPVWSGGGDRGIYKTTDGGKTWKPILQVSDNTGFNEVRMDPRNPDVLYATAHQRRRQVWTYISGGPESAIYKSTDGGNTWQKLTNGIPAMDKGRIGLAISPVNPDVIYAMIEGGSDVGGVYKSTDRGGSWVKQSSYNTAGNYYVEIFCDPFDVNRLYSMDAWLQVSNDGGKSWKGLGEKWKHVDNHVIWIDPKNREHYLVGCDGGLYESWDAAINWQFKANLPLTQFYKVALDNSLPFYYIYGGTQDNNSLGGPSRTLNASGILNSDWFITTGGDGFESQIDPENPNIVYAQSQYGGLVRYDRKSGEQIDIRPIEMDNTAYRWNWDAPLFISQFNHKRIYFAANKLFRSDDMGNSWTVISPDLTRQIDRNKLPVMGKVWSMDAVAKNQSTSIYGNIVAFDESPLDEKILFVGTDDGLVQATTDAGKSWKKISNFPGVPDKTYVNYLLASQFDKNTIYAVFNNHKNGDFKPYVLKSTDLGNTWKPIIANLPNRGSVYCLAEDFKDKNLLFVGTEFGVFFTNDGGMNWTQLKGNLPTIAVRDLAIQKRESDLVLATFGRGFYVLDNYDPLRSGNKELLNKDASIFPIKDALMYIESTPLNSKGKGFQGASFYTAENPPVGAVFTYFLKNKLVTLKDKRQKNEAELLKKNQSINYPSFDSIRIEDLEDQPYLIFTIKDKDGNIVRRLTAKGNDGLHRMTWDFRYPASTPVNLVNVDPENIYAQQPEGALALPGQYSVVMSSVENGKETIISSPVSFNIIPLNNSSMPEPNRLLLEAFYKKVSSLQRAVTGANDFMNAMQTRIQYLKPAVINSPISDISDLQIIRNIQDSIAILSRIMNGDRSLAAREFAIAPGLSGRVSNIVYGLWYSTQAETSTMQQSYTLAANQFEKWLNRLKQIDKQLTELEQKLEKDGAPYTPGRFPEWKNK